MFTVVHTIPTSVTFPGFKKEGTRLEFSSIALGLDVQFPRVQKLCPELEEERSGRDDFVYVVTVQCEPFVTVAVPVGNLVRCSPRRHNPSVEEKPTREIHSKPPYGWRLSDGKGSDLCEIPEEQEIIKIIKEKRDQSYSYADIAEYLTLSEVKPRRGCKRWYSMTIKRICERDNVVTKGSKATRTRDTPPEIEVESDETPTLSTNGSGATSGASSNPSSRPQSRRGSIAMDEVVSKVVKTFGSDRHHRPKS